MTHTPEPWRATKVGAPASLLDTTSPERTVVGLAPGEWERAVACVNACAGIPTDRLRPWIVRELIDAAQASAHDDPYALQKAIVEGDTIVIRVPIANLATVVEGAWACHGVEPRLKITDAAAFARDLCAELNREEENGTTPVHKLFDAAIQEAFDQGAEGIEVHEVQEP